VDGKIATGIVALRKSGFISENQWRFRRDYETVSTHHGCNEGAEWVLQVDEFVKGTEEHHVAIQNQHLIIVNEL